ASALELADDLRRHLDGEPIRARPVGAAGRLLLWCRRRPALVATILVAAAITLTVAGLSVWRIVAERDRYFAERDQARTHLYPSLVGEARALRLARANGYRSQAWARLAEALQLETPVRDPVALRQEAVACMGDFVGLEPVTWPLSQPSVYDVALALHPAGDQ